MDPAAATPVRYTITVQDDGGSFPCRADETVLHAMLQTRSGPVTHGCCGGGCGVCRMQVTEGDYAVVKKMSRAHVDTCGAAAGQVLLCCIQPRADMMISRV